MKALLLLGTSFSLSFVDHLAVYAQGQQEGENFVVSGLKEIQLIARTGYAEITYVWPRQWFFNFSYEF